MYRLIVFLYLLAIAFGDDISKPKSHRNRKPHFPSEKIVGGVQTPIEDVPYQVAIEYYGKQICGGSIISKSLNKFKVTVRIGSSKLEEGGTVIKMKSLEHHFNASGYGNDYDVSLVELEEDIQFNSRSAIVTVAKTEAVSGNALVAGWGEGSAFPNLLYSVAVPIINRTACEKAHENSTMKITSRMICAGEPGKGSCQGDIGSPLVVVEGDMRTQVGIVSWNFECDQPGYTGVYTNVAHPEIRDFIKIRAKV